MNYWLPELSLFVKCHCLLSPVIYRDKKMIVISDDDEDIIEINKKTKGEVKRQQRERIIPIQYEGANSNSEDDVHVIQEVVKKKKGVTIGSFRMYEDSPLHLATVRRRVKPDLGLAKPCVMKRTHSPSTLRCMNMKRKLFLIQREKSVRLEERMNYLKLIQSLLIESNRLLRQVTLPFQSPSLPKQRNTSQSNKQCDVEFVDLTSDSESDMIDVEKFYSGDEVQQESECNTIQENEVVEIPDDVGGSSSKEESFKKAQRQISSFRTDTSSESDENNDDIIDLVEENKHPNNCSTSKKSPSIEFKDPRINLEKQMLQQMNIADNEQEIIDVTDDDQICDTDVSAECVADGDEEEERGVLPKLTEKIQITVISAYQSKPNKVLVEGFNLIIRTRDILTLQGSNWLNDEIINFYMCLLMERGHLSNYPSCYCFNTFFYVKLAQAGHASLKRWTRKVDIFAYDLLIVPVHLKVHWCLACINFPEKRIEYYDSMFGKNEKCCALLMNYLKEEHEDKKKKPFDCSRWKTVCMEDIPEQLNGSDCGVFLCTYAEYICRLAKFSFTQRDMPYFRVKMAYEILVKKLLL